MRMDRYALMDIQVRSNNRDGQTKAMPDYSGEKADYDSVKAGTNNHQVSIKKCYTK